MAVALPVHEPFIKRSAFETLEFRHGVLIAQLAGPSVSEREAAILTQEFDEVFAELGRQLRVFVLDLSNVQQMCSLGLGLCLSTRKKAKKLKARTVVYGMHPQLEELFHMTKVDKLYRIAHTPEELERATAA